MRKTLFILAAAGAFTASPALAQIGVGGGVTGGAGVGVDTSRTMGNVTGTLDRSVDRADRTVNRTVDRTLERDLRVATSADIRAGASIRDRRGNRIGTVTRVQGDTALVVDSGRTYHVPLGALYRGSSGLVTSLSRADLRASAAASGGAAIRD